MTHYIENEGTSQYATNGCILFLPPLSLANASSECYFRQVNLKIVVRFIWAPMAEETSQIRYFDKNERTDRNKLRFDDGC